MGIVTSIAYTNIHNILGLSFMGQLISLCVSVFTGVIIYAGIILILKIDEIELIKNSIKDKLKK